MKIQAIIPMAGQGIRLKSRQIKALVNLNGKPLFVRSLLNFQQSVLIDSLILVVPPGLESRFKSLIKKWKIKKVKKIVAGGETRSMSVFNGLSATDSDTELIIVHDAARPFLTREILEAAVKECYHAPAVVVGVPVKSTIKKVALGSMFIQETYDRKTLWEIQTPQVFRKEVLLKAHRQKNTIDATDDAMLVERMGVKVKVVEGNYTNIKITTPEDVLIAKAFLK